MIQEQRINSLRRILSSDSQAALVTNETNVYYFSGIRNSEGKILLFKDEVYLLVDFRYSETARNNCKSCKVFEFRNLREDIKELMTKHGAKALYIENEDVTLSAYNSYVEYFSQFGIEIMNENALSKAITNLRLIKSEKEIEYIAEAQRITEKAYTEVLNFVKPGVTERKVALELEYLMKQYGASHVSFDLITITGKKTSLPHGVPSDGIIAEGDFFTMDIGALYNGYHSDMTRTVAVKSCSDYQREIYDIVYKAQTTALEAVKAGVKAFDIDKIARDIITEAGYGKEFGHSTGHGVGLYIHEEPYLSTRGEAILSENMVITVEPGIYLEGKFGVRIEDMVLVKENGYRNFATLPKELIIV